MKKSNTSQKVLKKATTALKFLDITQYELMTKDTPSAPLFVINRTNPLGRITFNCGGDMGKPTTVTIENVKIPLDLSMQAPRDSLLTSTEFRRFLGSGRLLIVEAESVAELFANNTNAARLYEKMHGTEFRQSGQMIDIDDNGGMEIDGMTDTTDLNNDGLECSAEVANILELEVQNNTDAAETAVLTQSSQFDRADCDFLMAHSTSDGIKSIIAERLQELDEEDEA